MTELISLKTKEIFSKKCIGLKASARYFIVVQFSTVHSHNWHLLGSVKHAACICIQFIYLYIQFIYLYQTIFLQTFVRRKMVWSLVPNLRQYILSMTITRATAQWYIIYCIRYMPKIINNIYLQHNT